MNINTSNRFAVPVPENAVFRVILYVLAVIGIFNLNFGFILLALVVAGSFALVRHLLKKEKKADSTAVGTGQHYDEVPGYPVVTAPPFPNSGAYQGYSNPPAPEFD